MSHGPKMFIIFVWNQVIQSMPVSEACDTFSYAVVSFGEKKLFEIEISINFS